MKSIEGLLDEQLAALWEVEHCLHPGTPPEANVGNEMARRLFQHPAQRIADLTGQWITQNGFGSWLLWDFGVEPVFLERAQTWASHSKDNHPYHIIDLPEDNRPWQESIYKPQVNVKNGGKDESTSAI